MKLVWSPERASKAYIDTIKSVSNPSPDWNPESSLFPSNLSNSNTAFSPQRISHHHSGEAELVSAMAAGWNSRLIVETWSQGDISTSIGLAVARRQTGGRHVCIVPDKESKSRYMSLMKDAGDSTEIIVGEAEEVVAEIERVDFMVVDCRRKEFVRALRAAKLGTQGAVLVCRNDGGSLRWKSAVNRRIARTVFLPVGKGLDIGYVRAGGSVKGRSRWVRHVDPESGEEHVFRK